MIPNIFKPQLLLLINKYLNYSPFNQTSDIISMSAIKNHREITPKINHTKTTISRSTPYLIRRHHLDDTEMKKALRYEEASRPPSNRTYSYQGEILTCQQSRIVPEQPRPLPSAVKSKEIRPNQYYFNSPQQLQSKQTVPFQRENKNNRNVRQYSSQVHQQSVRVQNKAAEQIQRNRQFERLARQIRQKQDYGLQQMKKAKQKMQKQAKKLRKLYKKNNQTTNIHHYQEYHQDQVHNLEEQIKQLKIKSLELQKQNLNKQLSGVNQPSKIIEKRSEKQTLIFVKGQLLLNKPRYIPPPSLGQDTDSSFSSFQLN